MLRGCSYLWVRRQKSNLSFAALFLKVQFGQLNALKKPTKTGSSLEAAAVAAAAAAAASAATTRKSISGVRATPSH